MKAEHSRRRKRLTPGALARTALAALAGCYVAWWVVSTSTVEAEADANPFLAARVAPDHPRVQLSLAMIYFFLQGGRVPADRHQAALYALKKAPLADEPFLFAGVDAIAQGREAQGLRLLEEARRRNPRLRLARILLLDRYLRAHRVGDAVGEMKALGSLISGVSAALTPELARMVRDPATAPQMLPLLRDQPALHQAVLQNLVASGADEAMVLNVAGAAARSGGSEPWKAALLSRLVAKNDLGEALRLWRSFNQIRGDSSVKGLYDGGFAGLRGAPPFNWDLSSGGAGVAEIVPGHGLQVDYYGRDNGNLASQLMMLRPGRYRFSFRANGNASGEGSRLGWTIACQGGDAKLLQLPITGVTTAAKRFTGSFVVPADGCTAQWLRLTGTSGDVANAQSATINAVTIDPEGAAT